MYFYPHFHAPFLSLSESALYPAKKTKSLTFPEINFLTLSFLWMSQNAERFYLLIYVLVSLWQHIGKNTDAE